MKTKDNKTISDLIKQAKFDWVSGYAKEFPYEEPREGETRIFEFSEPKTSGQAIEAMRAEGYEPMLASEIIEYAADGWNGTDWVVALGTVRRVPSGKRGVLVLRRVGGGRELGCDWFGREWARGSRFAGRRSHKSSELGTSEKHSDALAFDLPDTLVINGIEYRKV